MAKVVALAYVAGGLLLVLMAYLLIRSARMSQRRSRRRWVDRSGQDRRQRVGYLRPERRQGDRREDDGAKDVPDRVGK